MRAKMKNIRVFVSLIGVASFISCGDTSNSNADLEKITASLSEQQCAVANDNIVETFNVQNAMVAEIDTVQRAVQGFSASRRVVQLDILQHQGSLTHTSRTADGNQPVVPMHLRHQFAYYLRTGLRQ